MPPKRKREDTAAAAAAASAAASASAAAVAAAASAAAAAEAKAAKLEADWECSICADLCFEPATLLCGHSFCFGCVGTALRAGAAPACPNCRAPVPAAAGALKVNAALAQTMEANGGPGFRGIQPTLRLHAALRAGDAAGARAALAAGGCDVARRVRGEGGAAAESPLHFALDQKEAAGLPADKIKAWVDVVEDLVRAGSARLGKSTGGLLPLDRCKNFYVARLMLEHGAKVCTALALSNFSGWSYSASAAKSGDLDGILLKLIPCISSFDAKSQQLADGLANCLRMGHEKTALQLLEKGVTVSKAHPLLCGVSPLCAPIPASTPLPSPAISDPPLPPFPLRALRSTWSLTSLPASASPTGF
jgi:hypothetical protein